VTVREAEEIKGGRGEGREDNEGEIDFMEELVLN
jgi:hypothetical protein